MNDQGALKEQRVPADTEQGKERLFGKVVIVTGGGSGIGRAACLALKREGARVMAVDIDEGRIQATVAALNETGSREKASGMALDVRSEADMEEMARRTMDVFGRIDILVHCVGILRAPGSGPKTLVNITTSEWNQIIDINLKGTFLSNRAVLPSMIQQKRGHIVNLSSTSGLKGRAFDSAYCASKFGIVGLSEALAEEVRQFGIRVTIVSPDAVDTPLWHQNGPIRPPAGSLSPDRVAGLIVYVACLPDDVMVGNLVIGPRSLRRKKKKASDASDKGDEGKTELL